jgi:hypothetical protein
MRAAIIAFIVLAGSVVAGPAVAAPLGIYAGASYALVENDADRSVFASEAQRIYDGFAFVPQSTSASFDSKDSAYGFVVGWRLTEHLAVEGGYLDLGDVSLRDHSDGVFVAPPPPAAATVQQNIEASTSGIALSGLGILPLSYRWETYARAGLLIANSTESIFITDGVGSQKFSANKSGVNAIAGLGISFSLVEIYNVRLEYDRVFDVGYDKTLLEKSDVDMLSLSVTVSF